MVANDQQIVPKSGRAVRTVDVPEVGDTLPLANCIIESLATKVKPNMSVC